VEEKARETAASDDEEATEEDDEQLFNTGIQSDVKNLPQESELAGLVDAVARSRPALLAVQEILTIVASNNAETLGERSPVLMLPTSAWWPLWNVGLQCHHC
jgi:hypothetical protein